MTETIDWVQEQTGDVRADACALYGHAKFQSSEAKDVHGHPAAYFTCRRCGREFFHWVAPPE